MIPRVLQTLSFFILYPLVIGKSLKGLEKNAHHQNYYFKMLVCSSSSNTQALPRNTDPIVWSGEQEGEFSKFHKEF